MKKLLVLAWLVVNAGGAEMGKDEAAVWAQEENYWKYLKAGDVTKYLELWDEGFRGWPCALMEPAGKGAVGKMVEDVRDGKLKVNYQLKYQGAAQYEGLVVVHYGVEQTLERGGQATPMRIKITHTWKRIGKQWKIVGGMCGRWESYQ
ncbi:MAG: nuclear transport factor 2 family protein [Acidobacteria bacterium]|nr:nuclear transport factor 2 family protein [Acidobacteriota bacterium]